MRVHNKRNFNNFQRIIKKKVKKLSEKVRAKKTNHLY